MPETPVNEDDFSEARKDQIRMPREHAGMKSKSEAHPVNEATNEPLRLGVLVSHARHPLASLRARERVHRRRGPSNEFDLIL